MNWKTPIVVVAALGWSCGVVADGTGPAPIDDPTAESVEPIDVEPQHDELPLDERSAELFSSMNADVGWPSRGEFETRWNAKMAPWKILHCENPRGRLEKTPDSVTEAKGGAGAMFLQTDGDEWTLVASGFDGTFGHNGEYPFSRMTWKLAADRPASGGRLTTDLTNWGYGELDVELACDSIRVEEPQAVAASWRPFVYAATLTTPAEPVFVEASGELESTDEQRLREFEAAGWNAESVGQLLETGPAPSSDYWSSALAWAKAEGEMELAYQIHRRYRPMGYCSRDTRPLRTKREFASVCESIGKPRCNLALTTELLAYRVSRRSDMWIGGKPVSYESPIDDLPDTLDLSEFMTGLLVDFPGTDGSDTASISPHFFALSVLGSSEESKLLSGIESLVSDPDVDSWNKHRAVMALFSAKVMGDRQTERSEVAERLSKLKGVPVATAAELGTVE